MAGARFTKTPWSYKAASEPAQQAAKLEALAREIVKLHKERGCVLTVHVEQMAGLLAEIDAGRTAPKEQP